MTEPLRARVRAVIGEHGRLTTSVDDIADDADLYQAGLSSHASVNLMLALEEAFDVEFPERMLRRRVFESVTAIASAIEELLRDRGHEAASA